MNNISVIVFDLGNVLIPFDYNRIVNNLNEIEPGLGDKFYRRYRENYHYHTEFEKWNISTEKYIDVMRDWLENKVDSEQFCRIYSDLFTVNPDTTGLLPKLKKKYRLMLLSNTNDIHERYGWGHYEFLSNFEKLFTSHSAGARKPEAAFYKAVENFTGRPSNEHIFIDDVDEYVTTAKNLGWDGIHFRNYQQLVKEFESRGIL